MRHHYFGYITKLTKRTLHETQYFLPSSFVLCYLEWVAINYQVRYILAINSSFINHTSNQFKRPLCHNKESAVCIYSLSSTRVTYELVSRNLWTWNLFSFFLSLLEIRVASVTFCVIVWAPDFFTPSFSLSCYLYLVAFSKYENNFFLLRRGQSVYIRIFVSFGSEYERQTRCKLWGHFTT
jgi:hypothetical protein